MHTHASARTPAHTHAPLRGKRARGWGRTPSPEYNIFLVQGFAPDCQWLSQAFPMSPLAFY
ncbi:hypothetical protein vBVpPAC2_47 [Vibrio phage vB_VpP_AC2]|uniref:Uncharacterized protein n=1 Tax=Vibrio phage vB_VpP_AC2 TaxID=2961842 RepID=A0A9E7NLH0_9CAUD|nr:hypothetical protein vBVpPAC2_47 [Vibrio phage vB_VpP_AC2]